MNRPVSLQQQLGLSGGRPSGFDYMRISLSVLIVGMHSFSIAYGTAVDAIVFWDSPARPFARMLVPMFFALSGFLVAGSLERCRTMVSFIGLRMIRIFPALAVETVLSALLIGPAFTADTMRDYFSDPTFYSYLLNIIGDVHYVLPGLFVDNPFPITVNNQLWTVPYELLCYILLSIAILIGIRTHRFIAVVAIFASVLVFVVARLIKNHGGFSTFEGAISGPLLITCFFAGLSLFMYRDRIPFDRLLFLCSGASSIMLLGLVPYGDCLAPLPVAYMTVYIGLLNPRRNVVIKSADISYGIYLYGFAVQQCVSAALPWSHQFYTNFLISLPLAAGIATLSWHFIEKPALRLRGAIFTLEKLLLSSRVWRRNRVPGLDEPERQGALRPSPHEGTFSVRLPTSTTP